MKRKNISYKAPYRLLSSLVCLFACFSISVKAQQHWTPEINTYEGYMTITGYITKNNAELLSDKIEVACFVDGKCRGTYILQQIDYLEYSYPCLLPVWGTSADNGKQITIFVYDHEEGVEYEARQKISYQYNENAGATSPYKLEILSPLDIHLTLAVGGRLNCERSKAKPEETVSFTITCDLGYELSNIEVLPESIKIEGSDGSYSFVMPYSDVTLTPVFQKTADQIAVENAVSTIEDASFSLNQEEGNTEEEVTKWLVEQINSLIGSTGITVSADDIEMSNFIAAIEGVKGNIDGINGSFNFTVLIKKNSVSFVTNTLSGIIEASFYTNINRIVVETLQFIYIGNHLQVIGLIPGETLSIYDINGIILYRSKVTSNEKIIHLHSKGVYIIQSGNKTMKIIY